MVDESTAKLIALSANISALLIASSIAITLLN